VITFASRFVIAAAALFPLACSNDGEGDAAGSGGLRSGTGTSGMGGGGTTSGAGGLGGLSGPDAPIVPEGLVVTALPGGNGVLDVIAFTLRRGPNGAEIYAAVKNTGEMHACSAALSVEIYDKADQSLAAGIGGLLTQHFFQLEDGSDAIAACLGPGDVSMVTITDLPSDVEVEDVATVVYRCPYFALAVRPIAGLSVRDVKTMAGSAGTAYTGTVVNGFDVSVSDPEVRVFPVNRARRPLGMASGSGTIEIPPGGSWVFETNVIDAVGIDYAAYAAGALGD
jgi:hypothetical protein